MLDESYPAKGYDGIKKELGTLITPFGSALKKDAESLLDNAKILDSRNSTINLLNIQRKVYNIPITDIKDRFGENLSHNNTFFENGNYYRITKYQVKNGTLIRSLKQRSIVDGQEVWNQIPSVPIKLNTLFDVWKAFGAQYSVDDSLNFNEGSQELLFRFITDNDLKDRMVHIISNHSTFKSGGTNIHPSTYWTNPNDFKYTTFQHKNLGVQLSTTHEVEGAKIKEVTQMLSALSQNPETAARANSIYEMLANSIKNISVKTYAADPNDAKKFDDLYSRLSRKLVKDLATSTDEISQTISSCFKNGDVLPFSNPNVFRDFTKNLITQMNNDFITRYYYGTGGTLSPSHKMVQVYEDIDGNEYTQSDMSELAIKKYVSDGSIKNTEDIISDFINKHPKFQQLNNIKMDTLRIGDSFSHAGVVYNIDSLEKYYDYNKQFKDLPVSKVFNVPRDLKPIDISWSVGDNNYNLFDLYPVRLKYHIEFGNYDKDTKKESVESKVIDGLMNHFQCDINALKPKLDIWTQRNLSLLSKGKFIKMFNVDSHDINQEINNYFIDDKLAVSNIKDYYDQYNNISEPIENYSKRAAECVLGNIYSDTFNSGKDSVAAIRNEGQFYFADKLKTLYNDDNKTPCDYRIKTDGVNVYVHFVDKSSNLSLKSNDNNIIDRVEDVNGNTVTNRLFNGNTLYTIPENGTLVNHGNEDHIYIYSNDKLQQTNDRLIRSFKDEARAIIPSNLPPVAIDKLSDSQIETSRLFKNFTKYRKDVNSQEDISRYTFDSASKLSASWEKSREFIVSRIPTRSMQSFMEMKNIGYNRSKFNDTYVSVWQIFIQGSDFDIDQTYFMGHGFNKSGLYDVANDAFDYKDKKDLDIIESMPLPSGIKSIISDKSNVDLTNEYKGFKEYANKTLSKDIESNVIDSSKISGDGLSIFKNAFDKLGMNSTYSINGQIDPKMHEIFDSIIDKYNTGTNFLNTKFGSMNGVVANIKNIISDPSNQIFANKPVDTSDFEDGANDAYKRKENSILEKEQAIRDNKDLTDEQRIKECENLFEITGLKYKNLRGNRIVDKSRELYDLKNTLSPHDIISMYKQQRDNIWGQLDVAIGANINKVFSVISNYYNSFYRNELEYIGDLHFNPKFFRKRIVLSNGSSITRCTFADIGLSKGTIDIIKNVYGITNSDNLQVTRGGTCIQYISEFISSATNNTNQSLIGKTNAIPIFSSMHLYLLSLGFTVSQVIEYMTSPLCDYITDKIASENIYEGKRTKYLPSIIDDFVKFNPQYKAYCESFKDVYDGSWELSNLAKILKVNQRMIADIGNVFLFLNKFNRAMYDRELSIFKDPSEIKRIIDGKFKSSELNGDGNPKESIQNAIFDPIAKNLGYDNPTNKIRSEIQKILQECNNFEINYINDYGISAKKKVSLIGGNFNFQYYINNQIYRDKTIKYYNLLKNTVNIFDVVEDSPLFRQMINGASIANGIAMQVSKKYNFIFNTTLDVIKSKSLNIIRLNDNQYNGYRNNKAYPIPIDDIIIKKIFRQYDNYVISSFFKNEKDAYKFRFDIKDILESSGKDKIILYIDDSAKLFPTTNSSLANNITITKGNSFDIDLTSDAGIANFKLIMENLVLPMLSNSSSKLGSILKLRSVKNSLGLIGNQIVSEYNLNDLKTESGYAKYKEAISAFNECNDGITRIRYRNSSEVDYRDLFWIYNLVTNNEAFGPNRLSALFADYLKDPMVLPYKYYKYYADIDSRKKNIFNFTNEIDQKQFNNQIAFAAFNKRGKLAIEYSTNNRYISIKNPDFVINTAYYGAFPEIFK